jgi:hypothetical protein
MDTLSSAPTSPRIQNTQIVRDDCWCQIVSVSHLPHYFQSSSEYLILYQSENSRGHKWSYRYRPIMMTKHTPLKYSYLIRKSDHERPAYLSSLLAQIPSLTVQHNPLSNYHFRNSSRNWPRLWLPLSKTRRTSGPECTPPKIPTSSPTPPLLNQMRWFLTSTYAPDKPNITGK